MYYIFRKYQYFLFDSERPGVVTMRKARGADETSVQILRNPAFRFATGARPAVVEPAGMSHARRQYLSRSVRPYVGAASHEYFS